jgi:hypothetical protein
MIGTVAAADTRRRCGAVGVGQASSPLGHQEHGGGEGGDAKRVITIVEAPCRRGGGPERLEHPIE